MLQHALILRLSTWLANTCNVPHEFFDIPEFEHGMGGLKTNATTKLNINSQDDSQKHDRHVWICGATLIYGNHKGDYEGLPIDQMTHIDIMSTVIDGLPFSVSNNPKLTGHFKPGSLIIPLHDWREVYIYRGPGKKDKLQIMKNQALLFEGDVEHGGCTSEFFDGWHPSLHLYVYSDLHIPKDPDRFEVSVDAIISDAPCMLSRLHVNHQVEGLETLKSMLVEAYKNASRNSVKINNSMRDLITELQQLLEENLSIEAIAETPMHRQAHSKKNLSSPPSKKHKMDENVSERAARYVRRTGDDYLQLLKEALGKKCELHQTPSDGNCGYWTYDAVMSHICQDYVSPRSMAQLRQDIYTHAKNSTDMFVGKEEDASDAVFMMQGFEGRGVERRKKIFVNSLKGIFADTLLRQNTGKGVLHDKYWMNATNVLPVAVFTHKPRNPLVVYTCQGTTKRNHAISTDIYSYSDSDKKVLLTRHVNQVVKVDDVSCCMVLFTSNNHFQYVTVGDDSKL